jgi:hypothetical protein
MDQDLAKRGHPLDWELNRRRTELSRLERELAEREAALDAFYDRLEAFRLRYARALAPHHAELDELEAQIAERASQVRPDDASKRRKAERARAHADRHARPHPPAPIDPDAEPAAKPATPHDLRKTYRDLTKRIHPDLAPAGPERQRREALMVQANAAYAAGDAATLAYLLGAWELEAAPPAADDVEAALDRIMRQIAHTQSRLEGPVREQAEAERSELAKLMRRAELAERQGRDLMERLIGELEDAKRAARKRLKALDRRLARATGDDEAD